MALKVKKPNPVVVPGKEDQIVHLGQYTQLLLIEFEVSGAYWHCPKKQLHCQVEDDGAELAALLHTGLDRDIMPWLVGGGAAIIESCTRLMVLTSIPSSHRVLKIWQLGLELKALEIATFDPSQKAEMLMGIHHKDRLV